MGLVLRKNVQTKQIVVRNEALYLTRGEYWDWSVTRNAMGCMHRKSIDLTDRTDWKTTIGGRIFALLRPSEKKKKNRQTKSCSIQTANAKSRGGRKREVMVGRI